MMTERLRRLHSDESGQVLWIFMVSGLALVVLAALVFNTGKQATRKMEMQNVVDASAVSGAMWVARGMNIVSMNNVAMTEILGLIANIRAVEQAIPINKVILKIEDAAAKAMMDFPPTFPVGFALEVGVIAGTIETDFVADVWPEVAKLAEPTNGPLWLFMKALSAFSCVVTKVAPGVGIIESIRVGELNMHGTGPPASASLTTDLMQLEGAVLVPNPATRNWVLPTAAGDFQELCKPTRNGTYSWSPVETHGYTPLLGYSFNQGPFEKYKNWIAKAWLPSSVTGIPLWYRGVADLNLDVFCHSGAVPSLPKIPVKTHDWQEAVNAGGTDFVWTHTRVSTSEIEQAPDQPPPNVNFEPTNSSSVDQQQQAGVLAQAGVSPEDALKYAQGQADARPVFQKPVQNSTLFSEELHKDRNFSPDGNRIRQWVWSSVSSRSELRMVQLSASGPPVEKKEWVMTEDRYTFQYATIDKSFDKDLKAANDFDASSGYPQPFHFVVNGSILQSPDQLPDALKTLQYMAFAHTSADVHPWLGGLKVSVRGEKHPVFENPSRLGVLTYAQVQVYNPTSWDLYTQDWHVKLVPATLLEQFTQGGSGGSLGLRNGAASVIQELNAH